MNLIKKHIIVLLSLLAIVGGLNSCGIQKQVQRADKKYAIGEYYEAAEIYKTVYPKIKKDKKALKAAVAFRQGECYRIINHPRAISAYTNAVRYHYAEQDSIVFLRLAQVQHYQGKYKEAVKNYELYLQEHPDNYVAQGGRYACLQMEEWKKESSRYQVKIANEFNNKRYSSFAPCYIGDNNDALMFTSNRVVQKKKDKKNSPVTGVPVNQIYTARKDAQGKWVDIDLAEGLYEVANGESDNATDSEDTGGKKKEATTAELGVCCFSNDGHDMFFTYSKPINGQDIGAHIYTSSRASGTWGEPQELKLFADSTITCGHPSLNYGGDTLYFSSDAPGGYGGKDIWYCVKDGSDWSVPMNMGPQINTGGDEMFPTIRKDCTLFFSSNGHPGYGGLDIFKAVPDTLKTPEGDPMWLLYNMGQPFNSNGDDFGVTFATPSKDAAPDVVESGYFSSNRGQKKGNDMIYSFLLPEMVFVVEGKVVDNMGETVSNATLRIVGDDGTNAKVQARRDGTYRIKLNRDVHYAMLATSRGYLNQKQELQTFGLKDSRTYTQDFVLTTLSKPVKMENVFYEFAKWNITPESEASLDGLVKLLNDNPNITIELSAHTDMVGNSQTNKTLSEKRAQSCVNYLIKKGIDPERLTPVGYGKERPVVADKALHDKYRFIPVEQELNEEFILTLTKEQQEVCNQINRRTEFKVLRTTYKLY